MGEQVDFLETQGKTIKTVVIDDCELFVVFTDNTFSLIEAMNDYDTAELDTYALFNVLAYTREIITKTFGENDGNAMYEAAEKRRSERRKARLVSEKEQRRRKYEELKSEFEG